LSQIRAPRLWQLGLRGEHVKVGVVGTGVDLSHPDFAHNSISALSLIGVPNDAVGHETGIIWLITRIAPKATVIVVKDRIGPYGFMNSVIDACEKLRELGAQIINLSVATDLPTDGTDPLSREVNYLVEQGIVVVAAAGNRGPAWQTIGAPGSAEFALTVGKVDNRDLVAGDSSRGPTLDGRIKPDCVAPGVQIKAAIPISFGKGMYGYFNCTSYATPHVTGLLALLKEAHPAVSPAALKQAILGSCDSVELRSPASSLLRNVGNRISVALSETRDPRWIRGAGRVNGFRSYEWLRKNGGG
jgi:subtilisin family serine protease